MTLAEVIRKAMDSDGRSLYRLAIDAGIDRGILSRFHRGERDIGVALADKLCAALGLELRASRRKRKDG